MPADEKKSAVEDYFGAPPDKAQTDRAALIVALVQGRESATRTDYAHPKLKDIVRLLDEAAREAGGQRQISIGPARGSLRGRPDVGSRIFVRLRDLRPRRRRGAEAACRHGRGMGHLRHAVCGTRVCHLPGGAGGALGAVARTMTAAVAGGGPRGGACRDRNHRGHGSRRDHPHDGDLPCAAARRYGQRSGGHHRSGGLHVALRSARLRDGGRGFRDAHHRGADAVSTRGARRRDGDDPRGPDRGGRRGGARVRRSPSGLGRSPRGACDRSSPLDGLVRTILAARATEAVAGRTAFAALSRADRRTAAFAGAIVAAAIVTAVVAILYRAVLAVRGGAIAGPDPVAAVFAVVVATRRRAERTAAGWAVAARPIGVGTVASRLAAVAIARGPRLRSPAGRSGRAERSGRSPPHVGVARRLCRHHRPRWRSDEAACARGAPRTDARRRAARRSRAAPLPAGLSATRLGVVAAVLGCRWPGASAARCRAADGARPRRRS